MANRREPSANGASGLSAKQLKAIEKLAGGAGTLEAATEAGCGQRTVQRWLAESDEFNAVLRQAISEAFAATMRRIRAAGELAIDTLCTVMRASESDSAKVAAARVVLETCKWTTLEALAERVSAIEERQQGGEVWQRVSGN